MRWSAARSATARSALAAIDEFRPHVVVLDVNMPEMGGYEVLAALRAEQTPVKVLLLTADEHPDARNADDFLVKPFHPGELILRLEETGGSGRKLKPPATRAADCRRLEVS